MPGIGPKLKTAAAKFAQFRDAANRALDGIHRNVVIDITANYSDTAKRLMRQQGLTGTGYVAAGNMLAGRRALGGPVGANRPYLVGENGPEIFTSPQSGRIIPNVGRTVNINIDKLMPANYREFTDELSKRERTAALGALR